MFRTERPCGLSDSQLYSCVEYSSSDRCAGCTGPFAHAFNVRANSQRAAAHI